MKHIYVMSNGAGLVKVGMSRSLTVRTRTIALEEPAVCLVWATPLRADCIDVERTAHTALLAQRERKEWFRASECDAIRAVEEAIARVERGDLSMRKMLPAKRQPARLTGSPVGIRFAPHEMDALRRAAKAHYRPVSEMARWIIRQRLTADGRLPPKASATAD
jgi:hypothetical protein